MGRTNKPTHERAKAIVFTVIAVLFAGAIPVAFTFLQTTIIEVLAVAGTIVMGLSAIVAWTSPQVELRNRPAKRPHYQRHLT